MQLAREQHLTLHPALRRNRSLGRKL